jgi:hypothetical protein
MSAEMGAVPSPGFARFDQMSRRVFIERPGREIGDILAGKADIAQFVVGKRSELGQSAPRRHDARGPQQSANKQGAERGDDRPMGPTVFGASSCKSSHKALLRAKRSRSPPKPALRSGFAVLMTRECRISIDRSNECL